MNDQIRTVEFTPLQDAVNSVLVDLTITRQLPLSLKQHELLSRAMVLLDELRGDIQ